MTTFLHLIFEPLFAAMDYMGNGLRWIYAQIDRSVQYRLLKRTFYKSLAYWPNLDNPQSFNEKIQWRKLNDRAPVYTVIADKYRLRDYITHRFGAKMAAEIMPNWRLVTDRPSAAALRAAGTGVIIKPNHSSGCFWIVPKGTDPDWHRIGFEARRWRRKRYGVKRHEWAYHGVKALILVEDLVLGPDGLPAMDLKFQVMDGRCDLIQVAYNRHTSARYITASRDWTEKDTDWETYTRGALPEKPQNFQQMLALAEEIGRDFDYIRVDFLCGATEWKLNELTLYESDGLAAYKDRNIELAYGQMWKHRKYDGVWGKSAPYDR